MQTSNETLETDEYLTGDNTSDDDTPWSSGDEGRRPNRRVSFSGMDCVREFPLRESEIQMKLEASGKKKSRRRRRKVRQECHEREHEDEGNCYPGEGSSEDGACPLEDEPATSLSDPTEHASSSLATPASQNVVAPINDDSRLKSSDAILSTPCPGTEEHGNACATTRLAQSADEMVANLFSVGRPVTDVISKQGRRVQRSFSMDTAVAYTEQPRSREIRQASFRMGKRHSLENGNRSAHVRIIDDKSGQRHPIDRQHNYEPGAEKQGIRRRHSMNHVATRPASAYGEATVTSSREQAKILQGRVAGRQSYRWQHSMDNVFPSPASSHHDQPIPTIALGSMAVRRNGSFDSLTSLVDALSAPAPGAKRRHTPVRRNVSFDALTKLNALSAPAPSPICMNTKKSQDASTVEIVAEPLPQGIPRAEPVTKDNVRDAGTVSPRHCFEDSEHDQAGQSVTSSCVATSSARHDQSAMPVNHAAAPPELITVRNKLHSVDKATPAITGSSKPPPADTSAPLPTKDSFSSMFIVHSGQTRLEGQGAQTVSRELLVRTSSRRLSLKQSVLHSIAVSNGPPSMYSEGFKDKSRRKSMDMASTTCISNERDGAPISNMHMQRRQSTKADDSVLTGGASSQKEEPPLIRRLQRRHSMVSRISLAEAPKTQPRSRRSSLLVSLAEEAHATTLSVSSAQQKMSSDIFVASNTSERSRADPSDLPLLSGDNVANSNAWDLEHVTTRKR